jgi:hypothetical protein
MVGGQPVIVTEVLAAVLAVEREGHLLPAEITARHCSFFSLAGKLIMAPVGQGLKKKSLLRETCI